MLAFEKQLFEKNLSLKNRNLEESDGYKLQYVVLCV